MRKCLALRVALARMVLRGSPRRYVARSQPETDGPWLDSLSPFAHAFREPDTSVRGRDRGDAGAGAAPYWWSEHVVPGDDVSSDVKAAIRAAVSQLHWHPEAVLRLVARLAAVDGAVVMTADLDILGFGAMINVGVARTFSW